jgi:hypothetical protein
MIHESNTVRAIAKRIEALGYEVATEVRLPSPVHRSRHFRADIAVIREGKTLLLVEVKSGKGRPNAFLACTGRQWQAYKASGFPFRIVWDTKSAESLIKELQQA